MMRYGNSGVRVGSCRLVMFESWGLLEARECGDTEGATKLRMTEKLRNCWSVTGANNYDAICQH